MEFVLNRCKGALKEFSLDGWAPPKSAENEHFMLTAFSPVLRGGLLQCRQLCSLDLSGIQLSGACLVQIADGLGRTLRKIRLDSCFRFRSMINDSELSSDDEDFYHIRDSDSDGGFGLGYTDLVTVKVNCSTFYGTFSLSVSSFRHFVLFIMCLDTLIGKFG